MAAPKLYTLANDQHAARFSLNESERDFMLTRRITNRAGYSVLAIVCHIQDGSTIGSLEHFVHGHYSNGKQVTASCTYTVQKDGSILLVIPEQHGPWTNGDVQKPSSRGAALARRAGGDPNRVVVTIEAEGRPFDAMSEVQLQSIEWLIRDVADRHKLDPLADLYEHADFNSVTRANCAGPYYDTIRARLGKPTQQVPTDPAFGRLVPFTTPIRVTVTAPSGLNARQWGELDARILRTDKPGTTFWARGYVIGESVQGEKRWYIEATSEAARRWAGGTDKVGL